MGLKCLVIMLDGGVWSVFDKYHMPFLHSLQRRVLYSRIPITEPAVATILTGCDPHEHGFIGFTDGKGKVLNTSCMKKPFVWNTIKVPYGVINVPGTYPLIVGKYCQFMMSGFDSPHLESKNYYPEDLDVKDYVIDLLHVKRVHPNNCTELLDKNEIADICTDITKKRADFIKKWQDSYKVELHVACFTGFDRLMHFCYGLENLEKQYCEALDHELFCIFQELKPEELLIFSDHGFCSKENEEEGEYYLNMFKPIGINMLGIHNHFGILACSGDVLCSHDVWDKDIAYEKEVFGMIKSIFPKLDTKKD